MCDIKRGNWPKKCYNLYKQFLRFKIFFLCKNATGTWYRAEFQLWQHKCVTLRMSKIKTKVWVWGVGGRMSIASWEVWMVNCRSWLPSPCSWTEIVCSHPEKDMVFILPFFTAMLLLSFKFTFFPSLPFPAEMQNTTIMYAVNVCLNLVDVLKSYPRIMCGWLGLAVRTYTAKLLNGVE